jgi:hypothetical protein
MYSYTADVSLKQNKAKLGAVVQTTAPSFTFFVAEQYQLLLVRGVLSPVP